MDEEKRINGGYENMESCRNRDNDRFFGAYR
mgnify:CR=1 FL=1